VHQPANRRIPLWLLIAIAVAAALVVLGLLSRRMAYAALQKATVESALLTVAVVRAGAGGADENLILPGSAQGENDVALYARGTGYVRRVLVDIGATVKAGQLLAEIDTPELDEQLRESEAELATTKANYDLAQSTAERWKRLAEQHLVANQAAEEKTGDALAKRSALDGAAANVNRLRRLASFKKIVAPFDGLVTERNMEAGQLIGASGASSGETGSSRALFRVAASGRLKIYVQIPQTAAGSIKAGMPAELAFPDRPGKTYPARVERTANAIDSVSRTLRVELSADNAEGELLPGAFVEIHFKLPRDASGVRLPANTLIFRAQGATVAVVGPDNRVAMKQVTIARDFGTEFEVSTGVSAGDRIIVNPPDSLAAGQEVRVAGTP
jgi:membrane fusion protein (multidrug efflux system)